MTKTEKRMLVAIIMALCVLLYSIISTIESGANYIDKHGLKSVIDRVRTGSGK